MHINVLLQVYTTPWCQQHIHSSPSSCLFSVSLRISTNGHEGRTTADKHISLILISIQAGGQYKGSKMYFCAFKLNRCSFIYRPYETEDEIFFLLSFSEEVVVKILAIKTSTGESWA